MCSAILGGIPAFLNSFHKFRFMLVGFATISQIAWQSCPPLVYV